MITFYSHADKNACFISKILEIYPNTEVNVKNDYLRHTYTNYHYCNYRYGSKYINSRGFESWYDKTVKGLVNNLTDDDYITIARIKGLILALLDNINNNKLYFNDNFAIIMAKFLLNIKWHYAEKDVDPIYPPYNITEEYINEILNDNISKYFCDELICASISINAIQVSYFNLNNFLKDLKYICLVVLLQNNNIILNYNRFEENFILYSVFDRGYYIDTFVHTRNNLINFIKLSGNRNASSNFKSVEIKRYCTDSYILYEYEYDTFTRINKIIYRRQFEKLSDEYNFDYTETGLIENINSIDPLFLFRYFIAAKLVCVKRDVHGKIENKLEE